MDTNINPLLTCQMSPCYVGPQKIKHWEGFGQPESRVKHRKQDLGLDRCCRAKPLLPVGGFSGSRQCRCIPSPKPSLAIRMVPELSLVQFSRLIML